MGNIVLGKYNNSIQRPSVTNNNIFLALGVLQIFLKCNVALLIFLETFKKIFVHDKLSTGALIELLI